MKILLKQILTVSFAAGLLLPLCSCAVYGEMARNKENLAKIRVGMDKKQVLEIMGEPVSGEAYCSDKVFYYYTGRQWMDGQITRDECTPIAFDDYGKVIGWRPAFNTAVYGSGRIR